MSFDPESFLNLTTEEASSTVLIPVPAGEFNGIVESLKVRTFNGTKDPSKVYTSMDVTWLVDDQAVKELLEREKVTVRQSLMLDMTETGGLDMGKGKNVALGRLREAVGQNKAGVPWGPSMFVGQIAKIRVEHRQDDRNPENIFAEVKSVALL